MKVLKLGGSCLRDATALHRARAILLDEPGDVVVVVSAVQGVTDRLATCLEMAVRNDPRLRGTLAGLQARHRELACASIDEPATFAGVEREVAVRERALAVALETVSRSGTAGAVLEATVLSHGERCAALLLAGVLESAGWPARAVESDRGLLVTDGLPGEPRVDLRRAVASVGRALRPLLEAGVFPVVTGFFGSTPEGRVTLFGRNGSDYSAAVLARVLEAEELEIRKDVPGFLTADPRLVPEAAPVAELSFREAAEMAYFGARILHPATLEPLEGTPTRVRVAPFAEDGKAGTLLGVGSGSTVAGVASRGDVAVLRVRGAGVGRRPGVIGSLGETLAHAGINILSVETAQTCINLLLARADGAAALAALEPLAGPLGAAVALETGWGLVAVVGEGLAGSRGVLARGLAALARAGVDVAMLAAGASEVACYLLVGEAFREKAVRTLHRALLQPPVAMKCRLRRRGVPVAATSGYHVPHELDTGVRA